MNQTPTPDTPPAAPAPRRRLLRGLGYALAGLALILGLGWAALQVPAGREALVRAAVGAAAGSPAARVEIEGLGAGLPFTLRLDRLALADAVGPWFSVEGLELNWSPWPLFTGRLVVDSLSARRVAVTRLPESPESTPPSASAAAAPQSAPSPRRLLLPRLRIRELALDEVFLAKAVVDRDLRLAARSSLRPEAGNLVLASSFTALDGRPDRFALNATLPRDLSALSLDLRADEAPGGFLGWTLGLDDDIPLSVSLAGSGSLEHWAGAFHFNAPGALAVDADLNLAEAKGLLLTGKGRVVLAPDIAPARLDDLWKGGVDVDFTAHPDLDGLIRVERADLRSTRASARLDGWVHILDLALDARGRLTLAEPAPLVAGSGFAVAGLTPLDLHASGKIEFMDLALRGRADTLRLNGLALHEPLLDISVRTLKSLYHRNPGLAVNATLSGPRLDLDGRPLAAEPVLDAAMSTADFSDLAFPGARLRARGLDLGLDGHLDTGTLAARADLRLDAWDGRAFPIPASGSKGLPLSGRATAAVGADLHRLAGKATLSGSLAGLAGLHPALAALSGSMVGPATPLTATLEFDRSRLTVTTLTAGGEAAKLSGHGDWSFPARDFRAAASLDAPAAGPLGQALGLGLAGRLFAEGMAQGTPGDFSAKAEARAGRLDLGGLDLGPARASAVLAGLPTAPRGGLSLNLAPAPGPLDLAAGLASGPGVLHLRDITGRGPGLALEGGLDLDLAAGLLRGKLHAEMRQPDLLRVLPGRITRGAGSLDLALDSVNATQAMDLNLALRKLAGASLRLEALDGEAGVVDLWGRAAGSVQVSGQGLSLAGLALDSFAARAAGSRQAARFTASGKGQAGRPLDLAARGSLAADGLLHVELESLSGSWDGRPIALAAPADLDIGADSLVVRGLDLELAGGRVTAAGSVTPGGADLAAAAKDLPLRLAAFLLPLPLDGRADAQLTARGAATDPDISLALSLRRMARAGQDTPDPVLDLKGTATLHAGRLAVEAGLEGLGPGPLALAARLPLRCTLQPWSLALPPGESFSGTLRGEMDPAVLARFTDLAGHALAGRVVLDLALDGTPEAPALDGDVRLADGRYENAYLGLLLTGLSARLAGRGNRLELRDLAGSGPDGGKLAGSGGLDLDPDRGFPFRLDLNLDKLAVVRRDDLSLAAAGRAGLAGNATAARIAGSLSLEPVEVRIPDRLPPSVPDLEITEINQDSERLRLRAAAETPPAPALDVALDLGLAFPGRCFVRGRGLDAEFKGQVRISGRPDAPAVNGTLSVVRGRYEFLGKPFSIASGSLVFDGSGTTPFLNVRGEATTGDITAQVLLVGPPRSFTLTLESTPALPRDEILARLLFGRSTAGLNPVQAAQLANAVRQLTLGGPSLDPTATVREALGLDQLGVVGAEGEKGAGLTMGKYLRENVYIEVRQDLAKGGEEASLEVEVAPNLSVQSTTGSERSGVGVNWKKDY